jgi:hypothetical protein
VEERFEEPGDEVYHVCLPAFSPAVTAFCDESLTE